MKADLLGRSADAAVADERAIALAGNDAERSFLAGRLVEARRTSATARPATGS